MINFLLLFFFFLCIFYSYLVNATTPRHSSVANIQLKSTSNSIVNIGHTILFRGGTQRPSSEEHKWRKKAETKILQQTPKHNFQHHHHHYYHQLWTTHTQHTNQKQQQLALIRWLRQCFKWLIMLLLLFYCSAFGMWMVRMRCDKQIIIKHTFSFFLSFFFTLFSDFFFHFFFLFFFWCYFHWFFFLLFSLNRNSIFWNCSNLIKYFFFYCKIKINSFFLIFTRFFFIFFLFFSLIQNHWKQWDFLFNVGRWCRLFR